MGLVLALFLQLLKLFIIVQGSKGLVISPSPTFPPVIHPIEETPGPIHHGQSWGSIAPSTPSDPHGFVMSPSRATLPVDRSPSKAPTVFPPRDPWGTMAPICPEVPNGSLLHPPVTLPPPSSAPTPQKIKVIEPSISPSPSASTITLSPPNEAAPRPSTALGNAPSPSIQPSPSQRKAPAVRPPVLPPNAPAPAAIPSGNLPKNSPISQPIEHGSLPPKIDDRHAIALLPPSSAPTPQKIKVIEPSVSPSPSPSTIALSPPHEAALVPSSAQGNAPPPSTQPSPPQRAPAVRPPVSTPIAPAPAAIPSVNLPKNSPVSQPVGHGSLPPMVDKRNGSKSNTPESVSPAPVAIPSTKVPTISPLSQPIVYGSFPPDVHREGSNKGHTPESIAPAPAAISLPKLSPVRTVHNRNSSSVHRLEPVSQAPVALPPAILPETAPISKPIHHGSFPPNVHKRTANKCPAQTPEAALPHYFASPPCKMENNQPASHPVFPKITPSVLPAPVTSPTRAFPITPPLVHPVAPATPPTKLPAPSPQNSRQSHHAPEPLISSPKSPFNKDHSTASSPSTTFYKHHHTRNIITSPAPASSHLVSPPTSQHQDQPIPPSLLPTSRRRHSAPPPMNTGSSVSPFSFPILSPVSQVSPAPSPSFKISPHPTKILFHPPKVSPSRSSSKSPKKPVVPQVEALPPPPPNEDCLSTICSEPYANSPPGAPCRCVLPMKVGLRLSVSLYTFFPLVSELASEIATGVFMRQSQVRIIGANASSQDQDKTDALIYLVPLGEEFDNTTAFLTSERFWHKRVVIKASYFGDYEVLYVSYPGLPPSPTLPPSSNSMIDGGPYSNNGSNGRMIKPIGVDILKRQHKGGLSRGIIAVIALSVFLVVFLCIAAVWALFKCRHHVSQPTSTPRISPRSVTKTQGIGGSLAAGGLASTSSSFQSSIAAYTGSAKTFSANDIQKATDNFHPSRIIGEGGFGRVYSGIFEDGTKVAVKVLKREDHHGDREFLSEVEMLSRLHHRNLVKLIGICTEVSFRCLVYELIPNGSVESHLHGVDRVNSPLDWSARIKIALGAARGLAYLHEDSSPHVIHRDFKSSNILLEDDFTPKVSDFGLARTAADEENRHISTRVMGTFGYVAPEYAMTGHLLVKSDVYSYGVVLLELLTGRKPVDMSQPPGQENLVAWARPLLTSKEGLEAIIDPSLGADVPLDSVGKVAAIASMCVQPEVSDRPYMGEVVQALKLVCNECDEAKEAAGSRNSSHDEGLSLDLETVSGQPPDNFQRQFSATNYVSVVDIESGLSASEIFGSSVRYGRQPSGSFRRHSYSGPLRTGRSRRLWQIIRRLSGGSVNMEPRSSHAQGSG